MDKTNDKIIIELYDQAKQIHKYELLDIVKYDENEYAVMLPEYSLDGYYSEIINYWQTLIM